MERFQNLCRLCLTDTVSDVDLFEREDGQDSSYSELLMSTFRIQLRYNDSWSTCICQECRLRISDALELKRSILSVESQYQKLVESAESEIIITQEEEVPEEPEPEEENQILEIIYKDEEFEVAHEIVNVDAPEIPPEPEKDKTKSQRSTRVLRGKTIPIVVDPSSSEDGEEEESDESLSEEEDPKPLKKTKTIQSRKTKPPPTNRKQNKNTENKIDGRSVKRSIPCEFCGDSFNSHGILLLHQSHMHKDQADQRELKVICPVCEKGFSNQTALNWHSQIHKERITEQCPICGKYCLRLTVHIRQRHTKAKQKQKCTVCGSEVLHLRAHMLTHKEKRFQCDLCEKVFRSQVNLNRHAHVHTKERVKCLFCSHMATHKDNSRLHMKSKHPEEYEQWKEENQRRFKEPMIVVPDL